MTKDLGRLLRALVFVAWTAFFAWLLLSGEVYRYIGPRTQWVVVFGAVALGVVTVAHLIGLRNAERRGATVPEVLAVLALLVPLIAVIAVPEPSLGSLAASKKLSGTFTAGVIQPQALGPGGEISFAEIDYASESSTYASTVGIVEGLEVELTGFVTYPEGVPEGHFALTRFSIFCCAADVVPYSVVVRSDDDFEADTWLSISGTLDETGDGFVLVPDEVTEIDEPDNPYIR